MKKDLTEILFILDESSSMESFTGETIKGFNNFLTEQKEAEGEANLTFAKFSHGVVLVKNNINIQKMPLLTREDYRPFGCTALLDAIGVMVNAVGKRLAKIAEEERPSKVIVVIFTDGEENASHCYDSEKIKSMIKHQTDVYNWEFIFLGCNQDAALASGNLGISNYSNVAFTCQGMDNMYSSVSSNISSYRSKGVIEQMPEEIK